ncbi:MAG: hypothetical protein HKN76_12750, partial [Saprospiraceae bacterium]|nr:hypothetical protein [Saprospiraceae bacterium]
LKIEQIKLCASHNLGKLYALAAGFLQLNFSTLAKDQLEKATVLGQLKLLKLHGDLQ